MKLIERKGTTFAILLVASLLSADAFADQFGDDYVGCTSRQALNEFITAATNNDMRQMNALLGTECINMNGLEYSVVDRGWITSQVRVYAGSSSMLLYTVSEAVH